MNLQSISSSNSSEKTLPILVRSWRWPVLRILRGFKEGNLRVDFPDGSSAFYGKDREAAPAVIVIRDESFFRQCALYGGVGLGEAWMDGAWDTPDLRAVMEWFIVNLHANKRYQGSAQRFRIVGWLKGCNRVGHALRANSRRLSKKNIEEHYDLGNDFYKLWLDPTMTYSSAKFTQSDQSLQSAQLAKYEALCQKLRLQPSDHVLEIGCGWGGFAIYAARHHGCQVTGVTISQAQFDEATKRIQEAGLTERIEIRLQDYRDVVGAFDKIASIEMLEAVGDDYLETWCAKCHELLKPEGLLAVQMITVPDVEHAELKRGTDFIQKHIFPGSLLLAVGRMTQAMMRTSNFYLLGLEDLGASYARTLREWHEGFNAQLEAVRSLGFSERFIRKWSFYLKYCEAAFATRNISVVQAVYTRPCNRTLHHENGVNG